MAASRSFVLSLEALLEGKGLARKAAALDLLSGAGARLTRASDIPSPAARRDPMPTRVPALDRLLAGGLPRGGLVELSGRRSSGRFSIGISALAAATSCGEAAALVDLGGHLDPQAAEAAGVALERLLWVRPEKLKGAVASAEMLLSTGFPLVVVDLGLAPVRGRTVPDAAWLRLERAARSRGAALLVLAPYRISGVAAGAVVASGSSRALWKGSGRPTRLLGGLAARLVLEKDARARSGVTETMELRAPDALMVPASSLSSHSLPPSPSSQSLPPSPSSHSLPLPPSSRAKRGIPSSSSTGSLGAARLGMTATAPELGMSTRLTG
jgi:recA bacterial DNA recombination protein